MTPLNWAQVLVIVSIWGIGLNAAGIVDPDQTFDERLIGVRPPSVRSGSGRSRRRPRPPGEAASRAAGGPSRWCADCGGREPGVIARSEWSRNRAEKRTAKSGSCRVDTRCPAGPRLARSARAMSRIQMNSPVARNRCPAAAGETIASDVHVSQVADVDDLQADPRRSGHLALHHPGHDPDRTQGVGGQNRTEDRAGQDRRQGHRTRRTRP